MTARMLLGVALVLGGIGYGTVLALLADKVRRARRRQSRQAWRAMGGGRW